MVKPEKFVHLHLVYHFTVPLKVWFSSCLNIQFVLVVQSCSFSLVYVFNAISHYLDTSWKQKLHCYNDPQLKQIVNKCKSDSKK